MFHGPFHYEQLFTHNKHHFPNKRLGIKAIWLLTLNRSDIERAEKRKLASMYYYNLPIRIQKGSLKFRMDHVKDRRISEITLSKGNIIYQIAIQ